jgi:glycine/D-amino acid oxidase-like deaminating enzyme
VTSYWLETAGDDPADRAALDGDERADVTIVGAGLTGLWTAWYLRQRDPSLRVLVVEAATAGFGASGRNGAWLTAGIALTPTELARRTSPSVARETIATMRRTVDEVIEVCDREGIDAEVRRGGILRVARGRHEIPQLHAGFAAMEALGVADDLRLLDADALAARVRVAGAEGALHDPHGAALHPGRLVRGLARRVEQAGVTIVERTPVTSVVPRRASGSGVLVRTDRGTVTTDAVVLATEAWLSQLPGYRREVLPLYSLVVLTEPIDDDRWAAIGWEGHECLSSHRYTVDYLSRTVDGRVLFGGRGAPYHYASRIEAAYDHDEATHRGLRTQLTDWFPALAGVGFSHEWGGPLGMPRDWCPSFRFDPATGVGAAYGYTGQGVATSNLAGRVLADLLTTGETEHRELPMVGHRPRRWEPEPVRYLGARYLQRALARIDARAARTGDPPAGTSLAERLVRH